MEQYICKNSARQKPITVRLLDFHLEWQIGDKSGTIAYPNIVTIRLTRLGNKFKTTIQSDYQGEIAITNRFYLTFKEFEDRSKQYNTFIRLLHFHLKSKSAASYCTENLWNKLFFQSSHYQPENIPLKYLP